MTLYEKGINNYQQTIKFYDEYNAQQNTNEEYDRFIRDLVVNRLYCSLSQILWSFCYDDENQRDKEHYWDKILPSAPSNQAARRKVLERMKTLRFARNDSDYYANKRISSLVILRREAEGVFKTFEIFGKSKC